MFFNDFKFGSLGVKEEEFTESPRHNACGIVGQFSGNIRQVSNTILTSSEDKIGRQTEKKRGRDKKEETRTYKHTEIKSDSPVTHKSLSTPMNLSLMQRLYINKMLTERSTYITHLSGHP